MDIMGTPPVLMDLLSKASMQLLSQARDRVNRELLNGDGVEYRIAVVLAHAACDLQTEETLGELMKVREVEYLRDAMLATRKVNLGDDRAKRVYEALSGDSPWALVDRVRRADWWDAWAKSCERREAVAHRGQKVQREEADASVEACQAYVHHLLRVVSEVRQRLQQGPT
jgi:hypothetical protein